MSTRAIFILGGVAAYLWWRSKAQAQAAMPLGPVGPTPGPELGPAPITSIATGLEQGTFWQGV